MDYRALYRKYRPQTFNEVIGQEHVTSTLVREARERRVAHAYLFAGPRGTGKTSTARILAKAINCERPEESGEPCDDCTVCGEIAAGSSLDVVELDAASHNSVENIRDMRVQVTMVAAGPSAHRVFILDEAHMLSTAACNALLKTLEEPPPNVHFILATTEPYKLLDTIRSRSQRFDFHPVSAEVLTRHLRWVAEEERYEVHRGALEAVARHAGGSVRDSLSLLEQVAALGDGRVDTEGVGRALGVADRETMSVLARAVADQDVPSVLSLVARLEGRGVNLRNFISEGIGFFRGVFLAHHLSDPGSVSEEPPEVIEDWKEATGILSVSDVNRVIDQLGEALIKIREGREERLMLEMALLWIVRPETSVHPAALLRRIEALEARIEHLSGTTDPLGAPPATSAASRSQTSPPPTATPSPTPARKAREPRPTRPKSGRPSEDAVKREERPAAAAGRQASPEPVSGAGPLTLEGVQAMWMEVVGAFSGMDSALLRLTNLVSLEGSRLMVDCSNTFRLDRLKERDAATRISAEIERRTGEKVRVDFVIGDSEASIPPPPSQRPASPPPVPEEPRAPASDPRDDSREAPPAQEDQKPVPPSSPEGDPETPEEAGVGPDSGTDTEVTAFFEAADISVTEVEHSSGPSLF